MIDFEITHFRNGDVKSYCAIKDGVQFGAKLLFHNGTTLKHCDVRYGGSSIGTYTKWIDTGEIFSSHYFSTSADNFSLSRDWLGRGLGLCMNELLCYDKTCKFRLQSESDVSPVIVDLEAEESWLAKNGSKDHFSLAQPRYFGCNSSEGPWGGTVTFWNNGLVRTVCHWECQHIRGVRSCFSQDGYLWCEQNFAWDGSYMGNWTNRYFGWNGQMPFLDRVDVFRSGQLFKSIEGNRVKSLFDEVGLERYMDPLVDQLVEHRRDNAESPWLEIGPVDTSLFLV